MFDCVYSRDALRMVNRQHPCQQVKTTFINSVLILCTDELVPVLLREVQQVLLEVVGEVNMFVLFYVCADVICPDHLCDPYQLIVIVAPLEERLLCKHHARKHAPSRPHIKLVVVIVVPKQKLGGFEVPRSYPHVESLTRMVKVRETPINDDC